MVKAARLSRRRRSALLDQPDPATHLSAVSFGAPQGSLKADADVTPDSPLPPHGCDAGVDLARCAGRDEDADSGVAGDRADLVERLGAARDGQESGRNVDLGDGSDARGTQQFDDRFVVGHDGIEVCEGCRTPVPLERDEPPRVGQIMDRGHGVTRCLAARDALDKTPADAGAREQRAQPVNAGNPSDDTPQAAHSMTIRQKAIRNMTVRPTTTRNMTMRTTNMRPPGPSTDAAIRSLSTGAAGRTGVPR